MVPAGPDARLPNRASGSHKQEFHVTDLRCVDEKARPPHLVPIDRWAYHDAGPDSGAVNHGNGAPAGPCNALLRRTVARPGAGQPGPAAGGSGVGRSWWRRGRRVAATAGVAPLLTGGQMRAPAGRKRQDGDCGGGARVAAAWQQNGRRGGGRHDAVAAPRPAGHSGGARSGGGPIDGHDHRRYCRGSRRDGGWHRGSSQSSEQTPLPDAAVGSPPGLPSRSCR